MKTILVQRTIDAPIERVFEVLSDHAGYSGLPGIKDARLLKEGRPKPNGVGALRRIDLGAIWFEEETTVFERPTRMDYRMTRSRPPIEHAGGSIHWRKPQQGPWRPGPLPFAWMSPCLATSCRRSRPQQGRKPLAPC